MKIMYLTMGKTFDLFNEIHNYLMSKHNHEKALFYLIDKNYFLKNEPTKYIYKNQTDYLAEWDLTRDKSIACNYTRLVDLEKQYHHDLSPLQVMMADRRVYLGKMCKFYQDYKPRYNHESILGLYQNTFDKLESFILKNKPELIVAFTMVTYGEYIAYLIAKKHNIRFLQLRHTKIKNRLTFTNNHLENYPYIQQAMQTDKILNTNEVTQQYLESASRGKTAYEGTVIYNNNILKKIAKTPLGFLKAICKDIVQPRWYRDHHTYCSHTTEYFVDGIKRDFNTLSQDLKLNKRYISAENLKNFKYVYFPLHAEPEVAISVYSKFYQNQIEVIRNICHQLPVDHILVIKEHPRNIGRRSTSYYNNIMNIPGAYMTHPNTTTQLLIDNSQIVLVLSGFVGFEAVLAKKPVITLGSVLFNLLPQNMVYKLDNIKDFRNAFEYLSANYSYSESDLKRYINAIVQLSTPCDLYADFLGKSKNRIKSETSQKKSEQIENLAKLLLKVTRDYSQ